ncbi:MAG: DUF4097 family beta strand repeat protein [Chloroflexi bacterium]|nr:DUF4097 family beta strand repeat protein [Chloroflexota bacterium]
MEFIRTFTEEFEVGDAARLTVENRSGTISVRGEETARVRVEVVARLWAEDEREADDQEELVRRGIRSEGRHVTVRAPSLLRPRPFLFFGRGPRIDYLMTVPRATEGEVASRSGRVEVANVTGPLAIEARSGRVALSDIAGDVQIDSRSGGVQVESIGGRLTINSRSGTVRVDGCAGDVNVQTRSGALQLSELCAGLQVEQRSGSVRYDGDVCGPFDINLASGSIRLAVDPNSSFFLDAETTSGSVRSDLPLQRGKTAPDAPRKGAPTVRIRARSGNIHITTR